MSNASENGEERPLELCSFIKAIRILANIVKNNLLRTQEINTMVSIFKKWLNACKNSEPYLYAPFPSSAGALKTNSLTIRVTRKISSPETTRESGTSLCSPNLYYLRLSFSELSRSSQKAPIHRVYLYLTWIWVHHWEQLLTQSVCQRQSVAIF